MQIINVETKSAANGNTYKQVTLAEKAYGKDRTNVFSNHPLYGQLVAGYDIPLDQLEINQKGYLELKGGIMKKAQPAPSGNITEMAIKTHIDQHFAALRADLKVIADFLKVPAPVQTVGNTGVEYPEGEVDVFTADELKEEEIPF